MEKGMGFCTWYVRRLYRPESLSKLARELVRYKVDLVGVQEVKWYKRGTVRAGNYIFFYGEGKSSISNRIVCKPQNSVTSEERGLC
jgi:hypothetical protein